MIDLDLDIEESNQSNVYFSKIIDQIQNERRKASDDSKSSVEKNKRKKFSKTERAQSPSPTTKRHKEIGKSLSPAPYFVDLNNMASPLVLYRKNTLTSSPEITESGIDDQTKQPQNFYLKLASSFIKNTFDSQGSPLKSNIKKLTIVQEAGEDANLKDDVLKASPVIHPQKIPTLEEMPQSDPTISNFGYNKTQAQPESQVREEDLCVICFSNPQNSVNMPCGHGSLCIECSLDVLKKSDDCCICRELVE